MDAHGNESDRKTRNRSLKKHTVSLVLGSLGLGMKIVCFCLARILGCQTHTTHQSAFRVWRRFPFSFCEMIFTYAVSECRTRPLLSYELESINRHRSAFADFGIFAVRDFASAHLRVRNRDPERLYKLGETHSTTLLSFTLPLSLFFTYKHRRLKPRHIATRCIRSDTSRLQRG